jgi:hypothetical protein
MKFKINLIIIILLLSALLFAAGNSNEIIKKAMKDELERNLKDLAIENLGKPFFISYTICDAKTLFLQSTLGAVIKSEEKPYRTHSARVLVGSYKSNNENYADMNSMNSGNMAQGVIPLDDDYNGIRTSLWKTTDAMYKQAAEIYESKLSAIDQQNLSEEETEIHDFSKTPIVNFAVKDVSFKFEKDEWENTATELSTIFNDYSDIFSSNVSIFFYSATIYFVNSEGTETEYPMNLAAIRINAKTQAEDGEPLFDHLLYYAEIPEDLPTLNDMKTEVKTMADNLVKMKNAPIFDDSYSGPVLFEGQAVAEIFAQSMFASTTGLTAMRQPIFGNQQMAMMLKQMMGKSIEKKLDKKIISTDLTISANPKISEFNGTNLIGSFEVDTEGVVPQDDLVLVKNGILKTLLNGRTPTTKIPDSNGHKRVSLLGGGINSETGPGVIKVTSSSSASSEELKQQLIEAAEEEGLDYAFIIRKMESPNCGRDKDISVTMLMSSFSGGGNKSLISRPLYIYKVSLEDGSEELVRTTELSGFTIKSFKDVLGVSKKQFVYNTLLTKSVGGMDMGMLAGFNGGWSLNGIPVSFIVPDALLLEETDVQKEKRAVTMKTPVVENPVGK